MLLKCQNGSLNSPKCLLDKSWETAHNRVYSQEATGFRRLEENNYRGYQMVTNGLRVTFVTLHFAVWHSYQATGSHCDQYQVNPTKIRIPAEGADHLEVIMPS